MVSSPTLRRTPMKINLTSSTGRFIDAVTISPDETVSKLKELILHSSKHCSTGPSPHPTTLCQ